MYICIYHVRVTRNEKLLKIPDSYCMSDLPTLTSHPPSLYTLTYRISALALSDHTVVIEDKLWVSIRVPRGEVTRTMVLYGKHTVHCCTHDSIHTVHYCTHDSIHVHADTTVLHIRQKNPIASMKVSSLEVSL